MKVDLQQVVLILFVKQRYKSQNKYSYMLKMIYLAGMCNSMYIAILTALSFFIDLGSR